MENFPFGAAIPTAFRWLSSGLLFNLPNDKKGMGTGFNPFFVTESIGREYKKVGDFDNDGFDDIFLYTFIWWAPLYLGDLKFKNVTDELGP